MSAPKVPAPGEVIAGKYRVERVLGSGGMGVVLAARHLQLGQRVAIKFIREEVASDGQVVSRFMREAHAAVALRSEHATRVFDAGLLEHGEPYMVMEYLDGVDLDQVLHREGPMPIARAVDFVLQACEAVAEAHARGIVHRDLKPSNLFLTRRLDGSPLVKVLDFGVSKITVPGALSPGDRTTTGTIIGSPHYMSPEQMTSTKDVDAQTDIWALGVILYQLLTARVPFPGETIAEIAIKAATQDPPPLRTIRPDVPPPLEAAILGCLRRDRAARCASVAELTRSLGEFAAPGARGLVDRVSVMTAQLAAAAGEAPSSIETLMAPEIMPAPATGDGSGAIGALGTMSPVGRTGAGAARRKAGVGVLLLAGAAVAAAVVGLLVVGGAHRSKDVRGAAATTVSGTALGARAAPLPANDVYPADVPAEVPPAADAGPAHLALPPALSPAGARPPVAETPPAAREPAPQPVPRRMEPKPAGDAKPPARPRPAASPVYNPLDHL